MDILQTTLERAITETSIPSVSLVVRERGREVFAGTVGRARLDPDQPARAEQPYDLASVTKPFAGGAVAAALVEAGALSPDDPVQRWCPTVDERVRVHHLLDHDAGFPAHVHFADILDGTWGLPATRAAVLKAAAATPLEAAPGARHRYSDVGYLVLCAVLEAAGGDRIDRLLHQLVLAPSGVEGLEWGGWPGAAATERCPVRGAVVQGTVHDLNTAMMGGRSTHAGLFGTARAVAVLAERLMDAALAPEAHSELPGAALAALWVPGGAGTHTGGWDRPTRGGYTSTGAHFPDDARGHLGFTGCSVWVVPTRRTTVALLTNRIHPDDRREDIRAVRPRVHDAVARAVWGVVTPPG